MGHPQPNAPMKFYNATCDDIINRKVQQKLSKWEIGILELATLGNILLNINCLHITKLYHRSIFTVLTVYMLLKGCVFIIIPQKGIKVNPCLQEAIIIHKTNLEYITNTYRVWAYYKPIPLHCINHSHSSGNKSRIWFMKLL